VFYKPEDQETEEIPDLKEEAVTKKIVVTKAIGTKKEEKV